MVLPNLIQQGIGERKIKIRRVSEKIECRRGFGFHFGFWIESLSGICWFWLWREVLLLKNATIFFSLQKAPIFWPKKFRSWETPPFTDKIFSEEGVTDLGGTSPPTKSSM